MIIIEGMDNSGKSTLASKLADYLEMNIQESEGPPKSTEEINERVDRYELLKDTIFVRHPVISNSIYEQVRAGEHPISEARMIHFYEARPTLIYCDAGLRGLSAHVEKAHDTGKHLQDIEENYDKLLKLYRLWAAEYAHFIYRIGDDADQLISTIHFWEQYKRA